MALTPVRSYFISGSGSTTQSKTGVVVDPGEGIVLLVHAADNGGTAPTITGATWNTSESLLQAGNALTGADGLGGVHRQAGFCLAAPTAGTFTVSATFGTAPLVSTLGIFIVDSDNGIEIRNHIGSAVGADFQTITTTITTEAGDLVYDLARNRNGDPDNSGGGPGAGQTLLDKGVGSVATNWYYATSREVASTTSTVMSWPNLTPDSAWNTQAIAVMESAGGGPAEDDLSGSAMTGGHGTAAPGTSIGL
jgi:hypothetical protein